MSIANLTKHGFTSISNKSENKELTQIFQALYAMCVPRKTNSGNVSLLCKNIVSVTLDIFSEEIRHSKDNVRAREKLK